MFQVLHINNRSISESYQVKGVLRVDTVTYTGVTGDGVKRSEFNKKIAPASKEEVKMMVTFDDYYKKLIDQVRI